MPSLNAAQAVHNAYAWFETSERWPPGDPGYADPTTGLFVMTARHLWERG